MISLLAGQVKAQSFYTDNYKYFCTTNTDATVDLHPRDGSINGEKFVIPSSIKHEGVKYKVSYVFFHLLKKDVEKVKIIVLPNGITAIGDFSMFTNLEKINIPNTVKEVKRSAFEKCTKLSDVSIPVVVLHQ